MKAARLCCSRPIARYPMGPACFDLFEVTAAMIMSRPLGFLTALTLCHGRAQAAAPTTGAQYGDLCLELSARDESIKTGDDFFHYAAGHWLATHDIPSDRARWGTMDQLSENADERVRQLIQGLPQHAPTGTIEQKVGDFYRAFLDENAIDAAGLKPARAALDAFAAAHSYEDVAALMGRPD